MPTIKNNPNWNKIYQTEAPLLIATCRRYVKDTALAEDIVQEGMIKAIQQFSSFKGKGNLTAWLKRIVINEALMHIRKSKINIIETTNELTDNSNTSNTSYDDELIQQDFSINELLEAIDSLPASYRTVFNLYVLDEYKHSEIADLLHISVNTSKSQLMRARLNLQAKLKVMTKEKKKREKLAGIFFLGNVNPIDQLFQKGLSDFTISPTKNFQIPTSPTGNNNLIPHISNNIKIWTSVAGVASISVALYFTSNPKETKTDIQSTHINIQQNNSHQPIAVNSTSTDSLNISFNDSLETISNNWNKKNEPNHATFSNSSINRADKQLNSRKTLTSHEMKFLKSLGVTLIASSLSTGAMAQAGTGYSNIKHSEKTQSNIPDSIKTQKESNKHISKIEPASQHNKAQFAFAFPIGTSGLESPETAYDFSFNVLTGVTHSINGFELAGLTNMNKGHVKGCQIAGVANQTTGSLKGFQLSGVYNNSGEEAKGMQLTGIFNYTNWDFKGMQLAGIMNYTGEKVNGMQLAGIMNYSGQEMKGMQLSLVNYAKSVNGFQLGLINIADSIGKDDASLGLLNIYRRGGYREIELFTSDYMLAGLNFKLGSKRLYTIYSIGYNNISASEAAIGAGLGTITEVSKHFWIQYEAYAYTYNRSLSDMYNDDIKQSYRFKLAFRYNINNNLALSLAPSIACNVFRSEASGVSHFDPIYTFENKGINNSPTAELSLGGSFGLVYYW